MDDDDVEPTDGWREQEGEPAASEMIRVVGFDETGPVYANGIYVAADPGALHLIFTSFVPPPILTNADQQRIGENGYIPNQVVARVVVTPFVAEQLLRLLPERIEYQRQVLDSYQAGQDNGTEADDASS